MFPATLLLGHLSETDMDLLVSKLEEKQFLADQLIILEGETLGRIYFVLNGLVSIYIQGGAGERRELIKLGAGEVLGDVSWLERVPASASVRATESSLLAFITAEELNGLISTHLGFGVRFLRGLAALNASRVRRLTGQLRVKDAESSWLATQEQSGQLIAQLSAFKALLLRADREAVAHKGVLQAKSVEEIHSAFAFLVQGFNEFMCKPEGEVSKGVKRETAALIQHEFLPYLLLTNTAERMFSKPRGYAGDCETIEMMYENVPAGAGRLGPLLDACFFATAAAKAVRNRRALLSREILDTVNLRGTARITSLACGPATEVFDAFGTLVRRSDLIVSALDIDRKALDIVSAKAAAEGLTPNIALHQANLVYLATGRQTLDLLPQSLIYSIGLIDYFQDDFVLKLLDWIYDRLEPGGRTLLGNFHPRNSNRAFMDHILEWRLIHRDEDDMNRLFETSKFARKCTRILFEEEGINLFAECVKPI